MILSIFIVLFLATREVVAPLANDPFMSGRLIQSFRHPQCSNPSIISDSIGINVGCKICDSWKTDRQTYIHVHLQSSDGAKKSVSRTVLRGVLRTLTRNLFRSRFRNRFAGLGTRMGNNRREPRNTWLTLLILY